MAGKKKPVSKLKLAFAALGVFFCVVGLVKLVSAVVNRPVHRGPSELALHPDTQDEILAKRRAKDLQQILGLTDEQTVRIAGIVAAAKKSSGEIMEANKGNREALINAAMAKTEEAATQIEAVLTEDQRKKFEELKNERREKFFNALKTFRRSP